MTIAKPKISYGGDHPEQTQVVLDRAEWKNI